MVGGYLVKPRGLAHGLTGKVHIGLGLHHQYFMPLIVQHTGPCLEAELIQGEFLLFHQAVQGQPAHIVAGGLILAAGITQAHQQPLHASAAVPIKKQGCRLLACTK